MRARPVVTWLSLCRTWLDGEDVSERCFYASEERGMVGLYLVDSTGHFYNVYGEPAEEWLMGRVEVQLPSRAKAVELCAWYAWRCVFEFGWQHRFARNYAADLLEAQQLPE